LLGIVFFVSLVTLLLWTTLLLFNWRIGSAGVLLAKRAIPADQAECTIVVAARDEESSISEALASFLAQRGVRRVVLVDDDSSDATLAIAREVAASNDRLLVESAPSLPKGWIGKSHALQHGCEFVDTKYVLFTDADVTMASGTVAAAIGMMETETLDHLSGFFRVRCESLGEKICAPVLVAIATATLLRAAPRCGSATGAFNMINASFYADMGRHDPIRSVVVDDVALARLACSRGARSAFLDLSSEVSVRLFSGTAGFFSAVARSTGSYIDGRRVITLIGGIWTSLLGATTASCGLAGIVLACTAVPESSWILHAGGIAAALAYLAGLAVIVAARRYHNGRAGWSLLYPLAVFVLGLACSCSMLRSLFGRKIAWRGRQYDVF
jgi:Glycosyl transferase family 2